MAVLQVALMSIPAHKFLRPPYWYCELYETENCGLRLVQVTQHPYQILSKSLLRVLDLNHATDR